MRLAVNCVFLMCFDDKIRHRFSFKMNVLLKILFLLLKFFQKKKKKKKKVVYQVEVFKQASFFEKILPGILAEYLLRNQFFNKRINFIVNQNKGWRFFQKPVGPELDCLKTGTYLYFLFIYFFIFFEIGRFLLKWDPKNLIWKMKVLRKGYEILKQKKEIKFYSYNFFALKFHTLSWILILWVLKITNWIFNFNSIFLVIFNTYKNNANFSSLG